ncbi:hypothetical protein PIB30_076659 [Stylosanthes scabra]|uniref:Aminotransferase-like plant mobile domain-containing protein n=1 Tax=Stylosanthes scabra TaxID=79078 RepID=A0ABU6QQ09_9FABA|nr:hypothetical protein [Stylosanthes scabra]
MPEEHWFDDANEKLAYDEHLSRIEILPPKFIGDGVLPDEKYPEFWRLIDIQGLRPFLYMRERCDLQGGNNPHGTWNEFNKLDTIRGLWLEHAASGKYAISRMFTDYRLLLYVLSYVLLPRKSNHGSASEEDLLILWAMVQEKQIHWPYLMAHRMLRYSQGKSTSFLAHAHLLTKVFEIAPLDLTREDNVEPEISYAITSKNIHQMRRNLVGPADIADDMCIDVGVDAQPQVEIDTPSQIPTETRVPSQFQPDIVEISRKGFEDLRLTITEGFTRLSDRIDRIDAHLISQDMDIRNLRDEFRSFHGERMYVDFQEQPEDNPMQD